MEFLVEGPVLPMSMKGLRISDRLILEQAMPKAMGEYPDGQSRSYALAFVSYLWESSSARLMLDAINYLDFFLLVTSFSIRQPLTYFGGVGTRIKDQRALGTHKVSFPDYWLDISRMSNTDSPFNKPILAAKERFLKVELDRKAIMDGYLGIALRFYRLALLADQRKQFEEAVVSLIIVAEALVSSGSGITDSLKRRITALMTDEGLDIPDLERSIGIYYGVRSDIVHGHKRRKISPKEVGAVAEAIWKTLEIALDRRYLAKKKFVAMIDQKASRRSSVS